MEQLTVNRGSFTFDEAGTGEPVVLVHGALIADAFRPLFAEPVLTKSYRLIAYRRRGYEGSSPISATPSVQDQAADCGVLIRHLGLGKAHVVGHSFGGAVALQLALDSPELVHTLTLLEPALMVGASGGAYRQSLESGIRLYQTQGQAVAVEAMFRARWPRFDEGLERAMPGAFNQALLDSSATFEHELPALLKWRFEEHEASRISQPVLSVLGEESGKLSPRFRESHDWILASFENAEGYVLPGAHHFLQVENPVDLASALSSFFGSHPIGTGGS